MAKGFENLSLGKKKQFKKNNLKAEEVEAVVERIHREEKRKVEEKGLTKKASVILSKTMYKRMKERCLELDMSVTGYFKHLLEQDIGQRR